MVLIHAASSISHQPTFRNKGFSQGLAQLEAGSGIQHAPYKDYIDPGLLRRMSKVLRMGVACALEALSEKETEERRKVTPDAIIVGTGLGCLHDTEKFLHNFLTIEGLIPPTAFIQSTHNTIAGQISLSLGNHGYNMTHTQNTVSFEMALLDGMLKIEEGAHNVLVGAADEHIPLLDSVAEAWGYPGILLTSGASFFMLSGDRGGGCPVRVEEVSVKVGVTDAAASVRSFLESIQLTFADIDMVLWGGAGCDEGMPAEMLRGENGPCRIIPYLPFSGIYPTASAFAFHYAVDYLPGLDNSARVLIVNQLNPRNLGLILVTSFET